jgi:uncharacterized membrane protein YfcA
MVIKLAFACFFISVGLYYLFRPEKIAATFSQSAECAPKWMQSLLPVRFYKSGAFTFLMRVGGAFGLLLGLIVIILICRDLAAGR